MQPRVEFNRTPEAGLPRQSFGELLGQLASNSAALVRDEIELARQEMTEKVAALRSGMIVVAAGVLIGMVAVLTLTAAAIIGLSKYVGAGNAALIIVVTLAIIASIAASIGLARIKHTSLKPTETIQTLEEDKAWLKELT